MAEPTYVYVLFHETNTGHSDESDGYVEAIYATEEAAEQAKLAAIRTAIADGLDVYWNPDTEEENTEWTDDWRVETRQVQTVAPPVPPPATDDDGERAEISPRC